MSNHGLAAYRGELPIGPLDPGQSGPYVAPEEMALFPSLSLANSALLISTSRTSCHPYTSRAPQVSLPRQNANLSFLQVLRVGQSFLICGQTQDRACYTRSQEKRRNRMGVTALMSQTSIQIPRISTTTGTRIPGRIQLQKDREKQNSENLFALNGKMKLAPVSYLFLICFGKRLWREFGNLHSISESRPDFC